MSTARENTMTVHDPSAIDAAMDRALAARPEASALACVDAATGFVIASAARCEASLEAVTSDDEGWVHVHERVPGRPALFVVGVARAGSEIARLASCVRDVSQLLGATG